MTAGKITRTKEADTLILSDQEVDHV
jgi:hypothetical protein